MEALGAWALSIEGTPAGAQAATMLALLSALCHAAFGALQKGRHDPWVIRGAIDICYGLLALPVALFFVPAPSERVIWLLGGAFVIHTAYKLCLAFAYARADYTLVYPVVRGTGPLATIAFAGLVFGERFAPMQWFGVAVLSGGIFLLALYNYHKSHINRHALLVALGFAIVTGILTAAYTTYDAYGTRAAVDPMSFIAWFFVVDAIAFPPISWMIWRRMDPRPPLGPLLRTGFAGALLAFVSFGGIMLATRLDKVGEAAVLRETSVVFAALIGWFILRESVGPRRLAIISLIALGAIITEFGA